MIAHKQRAINGLFYDLQCFVSSFTTSQPSWYILRGSKWELESDSSVCVVGNCGSDEQVINAGASLRDFLQLSAALFKSQNSFVLFLGYEMERDGNQAVRKPAFTVDTVKKI